MGQFFNSRNLNTSCIIPQPLLPIQRKQHPAEFGLRSILNHANSLQHCSTRRQDIIDDQNPAFQGMTDELPPFTMVFGFFSVEGDTNALPMMCMQCHGRRHGYGYTLIGRAKQHIEFKPFLHQCVGVRLSQRDHSGTVIDMTEIEEIGAAPTGFQCKVSEYQYVVFNYQVYEGF